MVHYNDSYSTACSGDIRTSPKTLNVLVEVSEQVERHTTSHEKRRVEKLDFEI